MVLTRRPIVISETEGSEPPEPRRGWMTGLPVIVIACAGLVLFISIGFRQTFGLFLSPMEADLGWGRESFGFAIAMQNLVWGVSQPFVGALADRFGSGRVVVGGALIYMLGLAGMASADSVLMFTLSSGLLIGLALSGTASLLLNTTGAEQTINDDVLNVTIAGAGGPFVRAGWT